LMRRPARPRAGNPDPPGSNPRPCWHRFARSGGAPPRHPQSGAARRRRDLSRCVPKDGTSPALGGACGMDGLDPLEPRDHRERHGGDDQEDREDPFERAIVVIGVDAEETRSSLFAPTSARAARRWKRRRARSRNACVGWARIPPPFDRGLPTAARYDHRLDVLNAHAAPVATGARRVRALPGRERLRSMF
jgi:hypothetical protein